MILNQLFSSDTFFVPDNWVYRGEGNSNVVISLIKTRQILRVRKEEKPCSSILGWFIDWLSQLLKWDYIKAINKELIDLEFYTVVMRKLLGDQYVCPAKQVHISKKQIKVLDEKLMKFRPECRKSKCLQYGRATLFQDYAFLPKDHSYLFSPDEATFSVEIKPKQGWVPHSQRNLPKCLYCLNQYLKLERGQISKISSYCPLDLFSGDKGRMLKALKNLIENPQNNFRVFRNGICSYGENVPIDMFFKSVEEWFKTKQQTRSLLLEESCNLMLEILLKPFQSSSGCDRCKFLKNKPIANCSGKNVNDLHRKCDYSSCNLPEGSVLECIISVQKLDKQGSHFNLEKADTCGYIKELLAQVHKDTYQCPRCVISNLQNSENLSFVPYLIAAVARDCSLMLTFKRIDNCDSNVHFVKTRFGSFMVNVGIFDLYPKPVTVFEKHAKRNEKMHQAYLNLVGE